MKHNTTIARVTGDVGAIGGRSDDDKASAATGADFRTGLKERKDVAPTSAGEHTKPADSRAVIRATEGKRWTARQQGRG